jgi:hypothetical protein
LMPPALVRIIPSGGPIRELRYIMVVPSADRGWERSAKATQLDYVFESV